MSKDDAAWIPGTADLDYVDAIGAPLPEVLAALEADALAHGIPIIDRDAARVLAVLAAGRRRIVEVGAAWGWSALWMALAQPEGGRLVTIEPDDERVAIARGWWRRAGIADDRIEVVQARALEAFERDEPALAGPFEMAFIDALKREYGAYVEALVPRLAPGAIVTADNVLWSGRASGARPDDRSKETEALRAFNASMLRDPRFTATILPVGDGLLLATYRGRG
jgi:caffeoyl-CoA O-methyltransferase